MKRLPAFYLAAMGILTQQSQAPIQQKNEGPCSTNIVGSNNRVFTCQGIDAKTAAELLAILNKIAKDRLDPKAVMAALDDIKSGVEQIKLNTAPRSVSNSQKEDLKTALAKFRGQALEVLVMAHDRDTEEFADALTKALIYAGIDVKLFPNMFTLATSRYSLQIRYGRDRTDLAEALRKALVNTRICEEPSMLTGQSYSPDTIGLAINGLR